MCCYCIIGQRITLFAQVKITLAYIEEYLYNPVFSINPDDFIIIQIYICGNMTEVLLALVAVADINHLFSRFLKRK